MTKTYIKLMLIAAGMVAVPAAGAAAQFETVSGKVAVNGLNLAKADDVERFERRLRQQSGKLCNSGSRTDLTLHLAAQKCRASVIASGRAQLPRLIAEARARSGQKLALKD